jgi:hypothetical protein
MRQMEAVGPPVVAISSSTRCTSRPSPAANRPVPLAADRHDRPARRRPPSHLLTSIASESLVSGGRISDGSDLSM